jgi:hypothetical protein
MKSHKDGYGNEWNFFTKCTCKITDTKGIYQLSHDDNEHKGGQIAQKAEGSLTKIGDNPSAAIPLGHPVLTTTEPGSGTGGEDEITFTSAWFTPVAPIDEGGNDEGGKSPVAYCCPVDPFIVDKLNDKENALNPLIVDDANDDGTFEMPALWPRRDDDSFDDEDDDVYAPNNMGHHQKHKALFDVKTLMLEAKGETETEFVEIEN